MKVKLNTKVTVVGKLCWVRTLYPAEVFTLVKDDRNTNQCVISDDVGRHYRVYKRDTIMI